MPVRTALKCLIVGALAACVMSAQVAAQSESSLLQRLAHRRFLLFCRREHSDSARKFSKRGSHR